MTTKKRSQATIDFHALLDISALNADGASREKLCTTIVSVAPKSPLFSDPNIQNMVANVGKTYTAFVDARKTAAQSEKQHAIDVAAAFDAQTENNKCLMLLRTTVETGSKSLSDVASMGFTPYTGRPPAPQLLPPELIDVKPGPKGSGKSRAIVHETGITRRSYAARSTGSLPITATSTFETLAGKGKQRKLTGQPGTTVWVQFALVHSGQQSDWSAPVPVVFP